MKSNLTLLLFAVGLWAQPPGGGGAQADGIWRRDAGWGEGPGLDQCLGHQPPSGEYHYHANPICLRASLDDNLELSLVKRVGSVYREKTTGLKHSPILGWAYDGYPVYGPYGYSSATDPSSPIGRIRSGFRLRSITARTSIPTWSLASHPGVSQTLPANLAGPGVSLDFPLGRYLEDYEYVADPGDLDQYNGRTGVTPEFPNGTYAYFVTIKEDGSLAFPYMLGSEYYGTVTGKERATVPDAVTTYLNGGQTDPRLTSWSTGKATQEALVISGFNPSAGPKNIWPFDKPAGVVVVGETSTPIRVDTQQIRFDASTIYLNGTGLASHVMGPWFFPGRAGGLDENFPIDQKYTRSIPRTSSAAATKPSAGLGALGVWVNGVAMFNYLDGAGYSNAQGGDARPRLDQTFTNVSTASYERGPLTPGGWVTAKSEFGAVLATSSEPAPSATVWPTTLGGTTVTVVDSAGTSRAAEIQYVTPLAVGYRIPSATATGFARVTIAAGGKSYEAGLNILSVYPNVFIADGADNANAQVVRTVNGTPVTASAQNGVDLGTSGDVYLLLFGSGRGETTMATATIGGVAATVAYAGAQGQYAGLDQYNLIVPRSLAGRGRVPVVLALDGKTSNPVYINIR
jgi:uncharacterized protein (TIGR03437 family)